jgi:spermidine/putrescine transport system substrate-binding protein
MNRSLTRRELLQRGAAGAALLSLPGLLAACGGDDGGGEAGELADTLRFSNWPLYIDVDEQTKKRPTLDAFTRETGIRVEYFEDINDNAQYFGKIQGPLSQDRGIDRDIIVISDNTRFPGLLISKGWVEELDKDRIPNIENLVDAQKSPPFDPERKYSLPWQSAMTGIAWNEELSGPVESVQQLLEDPKLKGKVTMLMELADSVGLVMLQNGDEPENVTDDSYQRAMDTVQKAVDSGQIRRFTGNDYAQPLARGDIAAAVAWSGDVVQLVADNPKLNGRSPRWAGCGSPTTCSSRRKGACRPRRRT